MLRKSLVQFTLLGLVSSLYGCGLRSTFLAPSSTEPGADAIVLTDVDFDPESLLPETQPVADYLASKLKRVGISEGKVQIAPDVNTVSEWMGSGDVNLYFDSVYPAMKVIKSSGAQPILRRWKEGVYEYNTYFVVRKDSNITSLEDLQGHVVAMQDPNSSSGFMFPMVAILEAGINPVERAEANHSVKGNEIGYVFSGGDENTMIWLLEGKVAAGAIDNETWEELSDEERAQLTIMLETEKFPRHVVVAGPNLNEDQIKMLKKTMIDMDESRQGREALEEFSETAQFDEFPEGPQAAFVRLSDAYNLIENYLLAQSK